MTYIMARNFHGDSNDEIEGIGAIMELLLTQPAIYNAYMAFRYVPY